MSFAPGPAFLLVALACAGGWWLGRLARRWASPGSWVALAAGVLGGLGVSAVASLGLALALGAQWTGNAEELTRGPWLVGAIGGTAAGELAIVGLAGLGLTVPRGIATRYWVMGLCAGPAFVLLSGSWVFLLDALGVAPGQQVVAEALLGERPWVVAMALVSVTLGAPLLEEAVFRGWLLPWLNLRVPARVALWGQALAFGAMHLDAPLLVPPLVVLGAACGWLRQRSGSLGPSIVAHLGNNLVAGAVLFAAA